MKYLINVFPENPNATYGDLNWELKRHGIAVQIAPSAWTIQTDLDSAELCVVAKSFINDGDSIFVCNFEYWSQHNLPQETVEKLNN